MKKQYFAFCLYLSVLFFSAATNHAQQLDLIGKDKNPFKLSGGISTSHVFYDVAGIEQRREPYNYFLTGNLQAELYGIQMPVSFSVSNQNTSFQQPFNQYRLAPSYKWLRSQIGWGSLSFSNYTLAGHLFNGIGIEASPEGKFQGAIMYGRLQQAVSPLRDTMGILTNNQAAYRRMGAGAKFSFKHEKDQVDLIVFRAWDDPNSLGLVPDSLQLRPEENLVLSVNAQKSLFNSLLLQVEIASSALTRDMRAQGQGSNLGIFSGLGALLPSNQSTSVYQALKAGLTYQHSKFNLGASFERIDPEYRTLGAYFFNNDLENWTGNFSSAFFKQKVQLSANAGLQRNNLQNDKISQMERFIGAVNLNLNLSSKLNVGGSYSNFQTFTNIRSNFVTINQGSPFDNLDTLNYRQISQNATCNINYQLSNSTQSSQSISTQLLYQTALDDQGGEVRNGGRFYNFNFAYNYNFNPTQLGITFAFNANKNEVEMGNSSTLGPTVGVSKPFLDKKLRNSLSVSLNNAYNEGILGNSIVNVRLSSSYTLLQKHNLSLSMVALRRTQALSENAPAQFTEYTATFAYSYNFNIIGK